MNSCEEKIGGVYARLAAESEELWAKLERLDSFYEGVDFAAISTKEKVLIRKQRKAMFEYLSALEGRKNCMLDEIIKGVEGEQ